MEIFKQLEIKPELIAVHGVAFFIVMGVLYRLLFRNVGSFLRDRNGVVERQLQDAESDRDSAAQEREAAEAERASLRERLAREAEQHREEARAEARSLLDEARRTTHEFRAHAERELGREAEELRVQVRQETAALATDIARRALARALGPEEQGKSIEAAVRHVEQLAEEESP